MNDENEKQAGGLIRAELIRCIRVSPARTSADIADAVLERFEVKPRPAISDKELGILVREVFQADNLVFPNSAGKQLRKLLEANFLRIVKAEDAE